MKHVHNHNYYYVNYEAMGAYIMKLRIEKFGSNRCEFVRYLNAQGRYKWDQSAFRKVELGIIELSLDRLCEVALCLDVLPSDILANCMYEII